MPPPNALNLEEDETLCFISHHKREAKDLAAMLHKHIAVRFGLPSSRVFLDANDLVRFDELLEKHLIKTRVVLLLQTKNVLYRPFVIAEISKAVMAGIPIVPVAVADGDYDFEATAAFLGAKDFPERLEKQSPGAIKALEGLGIDVARAGELLSDVIPNLVSKKYDSAAGERVREAMLEDICDGILSQAMKKNNNNKVGAIDHKPGEPMNLDVRDAVETLANSSDPGEIRKAADFLAEEAGGPENKEEHDWKRMRLAQAGAIEAVLRALETGRKHVGAVSSCLKLVYRLARNQESRKLLMDAKTAQKVAEALHSWGEKDIDVAIFGTNAVFNLWDGSLLGDYWKNLMDSGTGGIVIAIMNAHVSSEKIARNGCTMLWRFSEFGGNAAEEKLMKFGAGSTLIAALKVHNKNREVVLQACLAIAALSKEQCLGAWMKLGTASAIAETLRDYVQDVVVTQQCLRTVFVQLMLKNEDFASEFVKHEDVILEAMRRHLEDEDVVHYGLRTIETLITLDGGSCLEDIVKAGAVPIVIGGVKRHNNSKKVRLAGVGVICTLTLRQENHAELLTCDAVTILVEAMKTTTLEKDNSLVANEIMEALTRFASREDASFPCEAVGKALIEAIRNDSRVAEKGCNAIAVLLRTYDRDDLRDGMVSFGLDDAVVSTLAKCSSKHDGKKAMACAILIEMLNRDDVCARRLRLAGGGKQLLRVVKLLGNDAERSVATTILRAFLGLVDFDNNTYLAWMEHDRADDPIIRHLNAFEEVEEDLVAQSFRVLLGVMSVAPTMSKRAQVKRWAFLLDPSTQKTIVRTIQRFPSDHRVRRTGEGLLKLCGALLEIEREVKDADDRCVVV